MLLNESYNIINVGNALCEARRVLIEVDVAKK